MCRHSTMLFLIWMVVLAAPQAATAQKLAPGTWTGTIAPPGNEAVPVTFDVKVTGDSTAILLKGPFGEVPFTQIKVLADRVTFAFTPGGSSVNCTLMQRPDKSYAGECTDGEGGKGQIVMTPPKPGTP